MNEVINPETEEEIWKNVVGYEDIFEISNLGRIWSNRSNKFLKTFINEFGYEVVSTRIGGRKGKAVLFRIHRLVADAFLKPPNFKGEVNHINGVKTDNRRSNLEWVTSSDNKLHAYKLGLMTSISREKHFSAKLKESDIIFIRTSYIPKHTDFGIRGLARRFSMHHSTIADIVNNKTWTY